MSFSEGMNVKVRGLRCVVVDSNPILGGEAPSYRVRVRVVDEGPLRNQEWPVIYPLENIKPDEMPELTLDNVGREARFRLLHQAFQINLAPPPNVLVASGRSRIKFEKYQQIPAMRMLSLPRPRIMNASDVGLGKTIETGICLRELIARRRGNRILIVCPASITEQWQDEMITKFGLEFDVFDRDGVYNARKTADVGDNPWAIKSRVIASMDFIKRREGAFRELQNTRFDVVVIDETHHLADNTLTDSVSDRHRLAKWLARASDALILLSATPHPGHDPSFASLLNLLEPTLVPNSEKLHIKNYQKYLVRHLKRHIKKEDGTDFFVPADPAEPLPVPLTAQELAVHKAVSKQAGEMEEQADKAKNKKDRSALRFVATILRKRAASSLAALRVTVDNRLENIQEAAEEIELRRDHIRALNKGETIPDAALGQLERDAHKTYLARIRAAGKELKMIQQEKEDLLNLKNLLEKCPTETETKAEELLKYLNGIHTGAAGDKLIVFSEYTDTIDWLEKFFENTAYKGKVVRFDGSLTGVQRKEALNKFETPDNLMLLSTDAASEGLNLQKCCHRVVHFELPFNPNRMVQRQGRVDRYGQTEVCKFAFLYSKDTYEGEVLTKLFKKIERQIKSLGSIGDVLGALQADVIEELISNSPTDVVKGIQDADKRIEEELARINNTRIKDVLGEDAMTDNEIKQLATAIEAGKIADFDIGDFVIRAIGLAKDGRCRKAGDILVVEQTPLRWIGGKVPASYDALYLNYEKAPSSAAVNDILDDEHPLVRAAVRWVRESRFTPEDDHRMAARLIPGLDKVDMLVTFIVTVRAADNTEMQSLMTVRVDSDLNVDARERPELLYERGAGEVPKECIAPLFGEWWAEAMQKAEAQAKSFAMRWKESEKQNRHIEHNELVRQLQEWNNATKAAIIAGHEDAMQQDLFGEGRKLPAVVQRRQKEHQKDVEERRAFIERRLEFEEPSVEHLGILLRVPESAVGR